MAFRALSLHTITKINWDYTNTSPNFRSFKLDKLNKNDTYIAIFSLYDEPLLEVFRTLKEVNILYEAPKAVNMNPRHGTSPRNTVVVFELASSPTAPEA